MSRPILLFGLAVLAATPAPARPQSQTDPERVVRTAERALQDDSLEQVSRRWREALARINVNSDAFSSAFTRQAGLEES